MVSLEDITIDDEFAGVLRELTITENENLIAEIERHGFLDPIRVWRHHGVLLDGHNRFRIWREVFGSDKDREPDVVEVDLNDRDDCIAWIIANNKGRRNLTPEEMAYEIGKKYEASKRESKGGQKGNKNSSKNEGPTIGPSFSKTSEMVAMEVGVGKNTVKSNEKYAIAVDKIASIVGEDAKKSLLSGKVKVTKKRIVEIGKLSDEEIAEEWERILNPPKPKKKAAKKKATKPREFSLTDGMLWIDDAFTKISKKWPKDHRSFLIKEWIECAESRNHAKFLEGECDA